MVPEGIRRAQLLPLMDTALRPDTATAVPSGNLLAHPTGVWGTSRHPAAALPLPSSAPKELEHTNFGSPNCLFTPLAVWRHCSPPSKSGGSTLGFQTRSL